MLKAAPVKLCISPIFSLPFNFVEPLFFRRLREIWRQSQSMEESSFSIQELVSYSWRSFIHQSGLDRNVLDRYESFTSHTKMLILEFPGCSVQEIYLEFDVAESGLQVSSKLLQHVFKINGAIQECNLQSTMFFQTHCLFIIWNYNKCAFASHSLQNGKQLKKLQLWFDLYQLRNNLNRLLLPGRECWIHLR